MRERKREHKSKRERGKERREGARRKVIGSYMERAS